MTQLLQQAIARMQELSDEEQDTIATIIFEELEDEEEWDRAFAASQDKLAKWAKRVRADIQAGRFKEMGWDEI